MEEEKKNQRPLFLQSCSRYLMFTKSESDCFFSCFSPFSRLFIIYSRVCRWRKAGSDSAPPATDAATLRLCCLEKSGDSCQICRAVFLQLNQSWSLSCQSGHMLYFHWWDNKIDRRVLSVVYLANDSILFSNCSGFIFLCMALWCSLYKQALFCQFSVLHWGWTDWRPPWYFHRNSTTGGIVARVQSHYWIFSGLSFLLFHCFLVFKFNFCMLQRRQTN